MLVEGIDLVFAECAKKYLSSKEVEDPELIEIKKEIEKSQSREKETNNILDRKISVITYRIDSL